MSFSLKREIEIYINDTDSTDGVIKLPSLPDLQLEVKSNLIQVFRKIIGTDPEMLPRSAVDQINPVSFGILTYIKPAYLDGLIGTSAPEKLLWDSLGGVEGYRGPEYYKPQFGRINRLKPLFIYLKTTNAIYKVSTAYVDSVEISFDIDYLLIAKWTVQAINLEAYASDSINFTNVKDYSNINNFIRSKFTTLNIFDHYSGKSYDFPITESSIKIQNVLMPVYDKNVKVVTGIPKDLIVGGRSVSGTFDCYLSSRFGHSKEFLENIYEDLTKVNRKYSIYYTVQDNEKRFIFNLPSAIINVPNVIFDDVLSVQIEFTSAESEYGLNDDVDIRYVYSPSELPYEEYVTAYIQPDYYYKFDATTGTTVTNYGSAGANYNMTITSGSYTWNNPGYYTGAKSLYRDGSGRTSNNTVKPYPEEIFISSWYKLTSTTTTSSVSVSTNNGDLSIRQRINSSNQHIVYVGGSSNTYTFALNTWYHICIYYNKITNKYSLWRNNVKYVDNGNVGAYTTNDEYISLTDPGTNGSYKIYHSEVIIKYNNIPFDVDSIVETLYNTTSITDSLPVLEDISNTEYNDSIVVYKPKSSLYSDTIRKLNAKAYWRFNDNGSQEVLDHITGNYPLYLSNNPRGGLDGPLLSDDTSKSIEFNKFITNQYASSNKPISTTGVTKQTFCYWIKISSISSSNTCLLKTNDSSQNITLLTRNTNFTSEPTINSYNWSNGFGDYTCTFARGSQFPIILNEWTFICTTIDKVTERVKTYVNGILVSNWVDNFDPNYWHSQIQMTIGKYSYLTDRSNFQISELAYFEYILPDLSIKSLYAIGSNTGFTIDLTPIGGNINLNGNLPSVLQGYAKQPVSGNINITGYVPQINKVKIIEPISKSIYILPNNYPVINFINYLYTAVGNIAIIGNIPAIYNIKILESLTGNINIGKYNPSILFIFSAPSGNIDITGYFPSVTIVKEFIPTGGSIEITGNIPSIQQILTNPVDTPQIIFI